MECFTSCSSSRIRWPFFQSYCSKWSLLWWTGSQTQNCWTGSHKRIEICKNTRLWKWHIGMFTIITSNWHNVNCSIFTKRFYRWFPCRKPGYVARYVLKHFWADLIWVLSNYLLLSMTVFVCLYVCVLSSPGPLEVWNHEWYHVVTNCQGHVLSPLGLPKIVKKSQNLRPVHSTLYLL